MRRFLFFAVCLGCLFFASAMDQKAGVAQNPAQGLAVPSRIQVQADFSRMPLYFIPNQGQMDGRVAFYVQGKDKVLYFTPEGMTLALLRNREPGKDDPAAGAGERWAIKLDFIGANPDVKPVGAEETGAVISYFTGKPEDWRAGLPTYSKIIYRGLWPGIDLVYSGDMNRLKYQFVVHPGADPSQVRLSYRGVEKIAITEDGRLEVVTPLGSFQDDIPVAFQESGGERTEVALAYDVEEIPGEEPEEDADGTFFADSRFGYGFTIGGYDRSLPLVLDPMILVYCGFVGGTGNESANGIAVDESGHAYMVGETDSTQASFPVVVGPDLSYNGEYYDVFVAKVGAGGKSLVYCGYIGGSDTEYGSGIAVDGSGNAYVTGSTRSTQGTFPVSGGPGLTHSGSYDAFVAKVGAGGTSLSYCGYIGGLDNDSGYGIAVDGSGNAYVTGWTESTEATFPVYLGPDATHNGSYDAFVAKVNASGTGFGYCGYIGGSENDSGQGIVVDGFGSAYVSGFTSSGESTFPEITGPDLIYNGGQDAFVAKVNVGGTGLVYCGYIGGSGSDTGTSIDLDGTGSAYVSGYTNSTQSTFPVYGGPDLTHNGSNDAFVAKVNPGGTGLAYSGYIGGLESDNGMDIEVDGSGNAYVAGWTRSPETTFPVKVGPDLTYGGSDDAFVAKVNSSGTGLIYCGYLGGSAGESANGIAVDGSGYAFVSGWTVSAEPSFPVKLGPDVVQNGGQDAFIAKVSSYELHFPVFDGHDYDSNGTSDIALYRPSNGVWYVSGQSDTPWGVTGDIPVPGNYDLDTATEIAVFRPAMGCWFILDVSTTPWGMAGDIPVPGDYSGDGVTDLAVWRPSNGVWYINGVADVQWGNQADYPVPGDYDGDGTDEPAVWRPANGEWFIHGGGYVQWGSEGDIPVPADYDGDGATDIAVYRPANGVWYIQYSGGGTLFTQWGEATDIPVPGDYNTDGATDLAVWRPSDGLWYIYGGATTQYGQAGDVPLVR